MAILVLGPRQATPKPRLQDSALVVDEDVKKHSSRRGGKGWCHAMVCSAGFRRFPPGRDKRIAGAEIATAVVPGKNRYELNCSCDCTQPVAFVSALTQRYGPQAGSAPFPALVPLLNAA